jgi:hypothetical protein
MIEPIGKNICALLFGTVFEHYNGTTVKKWDCLELAIRIGLQVHALKISELLKRVGYFFFCYRVHESISHNEFTSRQEDLMIL